MSLHGSQKGLDMLSKADLAGGGSQYYTRTEFVQSSGNGFDPYMDGFTYMSGRSAGGGGGGGGMRCDYP